MAAKEEKSERTFEFQQLPMDAIEDILSRVPAGALTRLRRVCKSWKALFSDPGFVRKHLHVSLRTNKLNYHRIFVYPDRGSLLLRSCSIDSILSTVSCELGKGVCCPFKGDALVVELIGSCDGLICLAVGEHFQRNADRVYVWNPCTKESKKLPCLSFSGFCTSSTTRYGFGYDKSTDEYKLVKLESPPEPSPIKVTVFTLSNCSAREVQDYPDAVLPECVAGALANGALHWLGNRISHTVQHSTLVIVALDLATEKWQDILLPEDILCSNEVDLQLCAVGGSLLLVCRHELGFDVWMMNECRMKESWTKLATIPSLLSRIYQLDFPKLISISKDGTLLMILSGALVLYRSKENKCSPLWSRDFRDRYGSAMDIDTVDSLVSPHAITRGDEIKHEQMISLKRNEMDTEV